MTEAEAKTVVAPPEPGQGQLVGRGVLKVGAVLAGQWELTGKLGRGGMGVVLKANDLKLGRPVAIKFLSDDLSDDPEYVQRFDREARLTAALEHPNIVPIYAVGNHEGRPYIVMKYLEGETLSALIKQGQATGVNFAVQVALQVCDGLAFIHEKGFVHRDIKPSNIIVEPGGHVTLLDFGILRRPDDDSLTRTGQFSGTPSYLAPECLSGQRIDQSADIYSLGVVLYQLLVRRLPYEGGGDDLAKLMDVEVAPPDVQKAAPGVPAAVAAVIERALERRRERRISTARGFRAALEEAHTAGTLTGLGNTAAPRAPISKLRATALGAGISLLLMCGVGLGLWWSRHNVMEPQTPVSTTSPAPAASPAPAGLTPVAPDTVAADPAAAQPSPPQPNLNPSTVSAPADAVAGPARDVRPTVTSARNRPSTPVPVGRGTLRVVALSNGEPRFGQVTIDGKPVSDSHAGVELDAGSHTVAIAVKGFKPAVQRVTVRRGVTSAVRFDLTQ